MANPNRWTMQQILEVSRRDNWRSGALYKYAVARSEYWMKDDEYPNAKEKYRQTFLSVYHDHLTQTNNWDEQQTQLINGYKLCQLLNGETDEDW